MPNPSELVTIASIVAAFGAAMLVFRIQRELAMAEQNERVWIPWADWLLVTGALTSLLLVILPLLIAGQHSASRALSTGACAATTVLVAGYVLAILAHHRLIFGQQRSGPRSNPEPSERLLVISSAALAPALAVLVFTYTYARGAESAPVAGVEYVPVSATWVTTATAVATTMVAVLVAIITVGQWITNRARLRHELFERRYGIYEKIAGFVAEVLQSGRVAPGADSEFLRQTKLAYFAFAGDTAIRALVDDIYRHAVELQTLQAKETRLNGEALGANVDKQTEVKEWFRSTLGMLENRFIRYLRLQH